MKKRTFKDWLKAWDEGQLDFSVPAGRESPTAGTDGAPSGSAGTALSGAGPLPDTEKMPAAAEQPSPPLTYRSKTSRNCTPVLKV